MWHKTMSQYRRLLYFQTHREDDFPLFFGRNFMPVHCIKSRWTELSDFQILQKMLSEETRKETARLKKRLRRIRTHQVQQNGSCRTTPQQLIIFASEYARWTWKTLPADLKEGWRPPPITQAVFDKLLFQSVLCRTILWKDSYIGNAVSLLAPHYLSW